MNEGRQVRRHGRAHHGATRAALEQRTNLALADLAPGAGEAPPPAEVEERGGSSRARLRTPCRRAPAGRSGARRRARRSGP